MKTKIPESSPLVNVSFKDKVAVSQKLTCSMCGFMFNAEDHESCSQCPLGNACSLTCCPNCGYEVLDVRKSKWASLFERLLRYSRRQVSMGGREIRLIDVPPGHEISVRGFSESISASNLAHLQAYGVVLGQKLFIQQQSLVTMVRFEHTELALDRDLAQNILVQDIDPVI